MKNWHLMGLSHFAQSMPESAMRAGLRRLKLHAIENGFLSGVRYGKLCE
jgi:hypothetical protein